MGNLSSFNYYESLGIRKGASQPEIKNAYRKHVLLCHPDHHPGDSKAEEKFKEISEAYGILGDPAKRRNYDLVSGLIGKNSFNEKEVNDFVEAFGEIIKDVVGDFDLDPKQAADFVRRRPKKRKKVVRKDSDDYMVFKQGGMTFKVRRKSDGSD